MMREKKISNEAKGTVEPRRAQDGSGQGQFGKRGWDLEIDDKVIDFVISTAFDEIEKANLSELYGDVYIDSPEGGVDGAFFVTIFNKDDRDDYYSDLHIKIEYAWQDDGGKYNNARHSIIEIYDKETIIENIHSEIERVKKLLSEEVQ